MGFFRAIISMLMIPVVIVSVLNGINYLFVTAMLSNTWINISETDGTVLDASAHTARGATYYAIGGGLFCSVCLAIVCFVLVILSFIFKSWTKAIFAGLLGVLAVWFWIYYINLTFPI